jgi:AraC-like DNA-binding protein
VPQVTSGREVRPHDGRAFIERRDAGTLDNIGTTLHDRGLTSRADDAHRLRELAQLRRVRDRIDREYAEPLDVEALARGANMSAGHLSRQFRLAYGESPYSYLMTRRIERAMALLRRGDLSVTDVCFEVGCSSLGTFSTRFTELVGVSPSVYRREAAGTAAGIPSCVAKQVTRPVRNREAVRRTRA